MLEDIKSNIARLIALYEAERQKAATLEERLRQSEEKSLEYKKQITDLNQQIANLELMHAFQAAGDPAASRERIGKLIKEIDRCIKLLES
jgi:dsDNA-specific endonuclease/ATPase MutS2